MSILDIGKISHVVSEQFPDFYQEDGPNFIQFVKSYYEWMEQDGKLLDSAYRFPQYLDIDTTLDRFIDHFKQTYMLGLPKEILGNPRFVQKHILDIYRSKGSPESVKLLFRLLYNEEISIYVPAVDMFRLDDGKWIQRSYIELDPSPNRTLEQFQGKEIVGLNSKARAYVSTYERRQFNGKIIHVLFLENVRGSFLRNEPVSYSGMVASEAPTIRGSVVGIDITSSSRNFNIGDILFVKDELQFLKLKVTGLRSLSTGVIEPEIVYGGQGYTTNAVVSVVGNSNTSGSGASFVVGEVSNTVQLYFTDVLIDDYDTVNINAADYGFQGFATSLTSTLDEALDFTIKEVGTISRIDTLSPGVNYDGNVSISVYQSDVADLLIPGEQGNVWGNNAVITNQAIYGDGLAQSVKIVSSGFNYYNEGEPKTFTLQSNSLQTITGTLVLGGVGTEEGYYQGSGGFLDANKYLTDDYYYQEFSYEVLSSRSLDRFSTILKQLVHPVGNELFGRPRVTDVVASSTHVTERITQETS